MSFLDNVKNKLGGLGGGRQSEIGFEGFGYDEYDSYDDLDEDDTFDSFSQNKNDSYEAKQSVKQASSLSTSRGNYQLDEHPPLISLSDMRAQGVAELQQQAARSSSTSRAPRSEVRVATAPYGSEPTELRGDTPEFYASRSGQVRARGTTGNFPAQPFRQLVLVRPNTYADAEKVAEALKEGHAVAIDLRNTRPELAKRILDFSFGAASVLGGQVETPANRVYAISVGPALTPEEHELLTARGVA